MFDMTLGLKGRHMLIAASLPLIMCGPGCHRRSASVDRQAIERHHYERRAA
jgi:hypothetical protein